VNFTEKGYSTFNTYEIFKQFVFGMSVLTITLIYGVCLSHRSKHILKSHFGALTEHK